MKKERAKRNRTITLTDLERLELRKGLSVLKSISSVDDILDKTFHQDLFDIIKFLPKHFADLIIVLHGNEKRDAALRAIGRTQWKTFGLEFSKKKIISLM